MKIVKSIKEFRQVMGLRQHKLAREIGITQGLISLYENKRTPIASWNRIALIKFAKKNGYDLKIEE